MNRSTVIAETTIMNAARLLDGLADTQAPAEGGALTAAQVNEVLGVVEILERLAEKVGTNG